MIRRTYVEGARTQVVAYVREDRWGESVATQRKLIKKHAEQSGLTIMKWYEDKAGPGYDRLDWDEATDLLRKGPVYRLLYSSLDRLGDTVQGLLELAGGAEAEGWIMEGVDGTSSNYTPFERAAYSLAAVQAEKVANLRDAGRYTLQFSETEMKEIHALLMMATKANRAARPYAERFFWR